MSVKTLQHIKWIVTDFDGIFTDNCVYVNSDKQMSRRLNFKDIMGVSIAKKQGIEIAIISGEKNSAIELVAEKFALKEVHGDIRKKIDVLKGIVDKYGLSQAEFLYIGDDINDMECLEFSKHRYSVPNATDKVKKIKGIKITKNFGGEGAFREIVDGVLESRVRAKIEL